MKNTRTAQRQNQKYLSAHKHYTTVLAVFSCLALIILQQGVQGQSVTQVLQDSILYQGLRQPSKSYTFYQFTASSATYQPSSTYISIALDAANSKSDPDIFISKTNQNPRSEQESDQYCVKAGSDFCVLKLNYLKAGETVYFGVKCAAQCQYSLFVSYEQVLNITDGQKITQKFDARNILIYKFTIPQNTSDGQTESIYFNVDSLSLQTPIQLYFSLNEDLSTLPEKDFDLVTETGKSLRFTSGDMGWCRRCSAFFIVSTSGSSQFTISGKASARREVVYDQIPLNRQFNALRNECFAYNVTKLNNDFVVQTNLYQGDTSIAISTRNPNTSLPSNQFIIQSESAQNRQILVRSFDRMRLGQSSGIIYFCAAPLLDSSISFSITQKFYNLRFNLDDQQVATFNLDSRDFVYFVYSNYLLSQNQQLTIKLQTFNTNASIPRIIYRVCNQSSPDDCYLTDQQATTLNNQNGVTLLNGTVNQQTMTRTAVINHTAGVCPFPMSCSYLISIYNPEIMSSMKVNLQVSLSNYDPLPLPVFSQYVNILQMNQYQYFQVTIPPKYAKTLTISRLIITLNSYNGRAQLYLSTKNQNPSASNFEQKATSLFSVNQLTYDVSGQDLSQLQLFLGIYGSTFSQYQIKVDAQYTYILPQMFLDPLEAELNQILSNTKANLSALNITTVNLVEDDTLQQVNLNTDMNDLLYYYQPTLDVQNNRKSIFIRPSVWFQSPNATYSFNVTYRNYTWTNLNSSIMIDQNDTLRFDVNYKLFIRARANFIVTVTNTTRLVDKKNVSVITYSRPNITISMDIHTAGNLGPSNFIEATANRQYEGYMNTTQVVFKHLLMDSLATYTYTLKNKVGYPQFMVKNGKPQTTMSIKDDSSYDFANYVIDENEQMVIKVDKQTRENVNFTCRNASFPIRGGNEICSVYIAVQCDGYCIYNLTISQESLVNMDAPTLIREGQIVSGSVGRNASAFYFFPFIRNQTQDVAFSLLKQTNDSFIVARIISNAYLPYYNWSFPNATSNDARSQNANTSYEIIEISNATLQLRCPFNNSCALILAVIGNAPQNGSNSTFNLNYLTGRNRVNNSAVVRRNLANQGQYDYFWFIVQARDNRTKALLQWSQVITAGVNDSNKEVDVYLSTVSGAQPTSESFDLKGDKYGSEMINLSQDNPVLSKYAIGDRILFVVGVKAVTPNTTYTLINWGPTQLNQTVFNFTDLTLGINSTYTFLPIARGGNGQYKIFRFFNFGVRDMIFNITCTDGSVYALVNSHPYRANQQNMYLDIPIFNQTSQSQPLNLTKGRSTLISLSKSNDQYGIWCQFCWYYIAVFQNANTTTQQSIVNVRVNETLDSGQYVPILRMGSSVRVPSLVTDAVFQRKFILNYKSDVLITISSTKADIYSVFVGNYSSYLLNPNILQQSGSGTQFIKIKQSDPRFIPGVYYYITVLGSGGSVIDVTMSISQTRDITLLKSSQTLIDKMWTAQDYVKFYYYLQPDQMQNYTIQLNILSQTPGFSPSVYLWRQDYINTTTNAVNYSSLAFPTMTNYSLAFEKPFYQPFNQSTQIQFPVLTQNQTTIISQNVSSQMNVTNKTTKLNTTVTVWSLSNYSIQSLNMSYYTIAVYWNNYGFTDNEKAEFEITLNLVQQSQAQPKLNQPKNLKEIMKKQKQNQLSQNLELSEKSLNESDRNQESIIMIQ